MFKLTTMFYLVMSTFAQAGATSSGMYCLPLKQAINYQHKNGWKAMSVEKSGFNNVYSWYREGEKDNIDYTMQVPFIFDMTTGRIINVMCKFRKENK